MNKSTLLALGRPEKPRAESPPAEIASDATPAGAVERAAAIVQELTEKQTRVANRIAEISEERGSMAFAAHADGDAVARSRLDALNAEGATITGELESIEAAIAEANSRLEAARQAEATAADRAQAHELRQTLDRFRACGQDMTDALAKFAAASKLALEHVTAINALGSAYPTTQQLLVVGRIALLTALGETPWRRDFEMIPPNRRTDFAALIEGWGAMVENNIRARLGETDEAA